jgi:hypothetical protein
MYCACYLSLTLSNSELDGALLFILSLDFLQGHECGIALAKMSFDTEYLDNFDDLDQLNFGEKLELDNWIEKFQYYRNYPILGRVVPPSQLPSNQQWTLAELQQANAEITPPPGYATTPIYVAIKGKVVRNILCCNVCFSFSLLHMFLPILK